MAKHGWRGLGVAVAAVVALAGCTDDPEPPTPTPSDPVPPTTAPTETPTDMVTEPSESPEATETSNPFDPLGDPPPMMPETVGQWAAASAVTSERTTYQHEETDDLISVTVWSFIDKERAQQEMPDSVEIGDWLCGVRESASANMYCSINAWNGALSLMSNTLDGEAITVFGDELLAVWE